MKANTLMAELAQLLPHVTPVIIDDIPLFQRFFALEREHGRENHGLGYSYLIQAMNRIGPLGGPQLGYKYHDRDVLIPIVVYPRMGSLENLAVYFILPMSDDANFGIQGLDQVINMTKQIREAGYKEPIYVKKVFTEQADYLRERGFQHISVLPWHSSAHSEDDTYPELIYNCQETLDLAQTSARQTRINREYRYLKNLQERLQVETSSERFNEAAWSVTTSFFESIRNKKKTNLSDPADYYNMIFNNPEREGLVREAVYVSGEPVAFYIMETQPGSEVTNYYAALALRNEYNYLGAINFFRMFESTEAQYGNLGGSEDIGLHRFKEKFKPVSERKMHWVVNVI